MKRYLAGIFPSKDSLPGSLKNGGIYYLELHKNLSPFSGIDLKTEEGKNRIKEALCSFVNILFDLKDEKLRREQVRLRMREKGLSDEDIQYCLG
ncbi:hypothetical protein [Parabacteroides chinchillae]|nr:hypothetical protein [Parabacteroides chinchillae]